MPTLPAFYIDNVRLQYTDTYILRGNVVSDCQGDDIVGITALNCDVLRAKNNKVLRMRSPLNNAEGFEINGSDDALLLYNIASRCDFGFVFRDTAILDVYNLTSHNCSTHISTQTVSGSAYTGTFRNIALSAYPDWKDYKSCVGFTSTNDVTLDVDYMMHSGIGTLYGGYGPVVAGSNITENDIWYMDEPNDDLTPDHISETVNSGTANPLRTDDPCIGGIESEITDEITADRKYQYELLDNSFWDIDNQKSVEMSFIKAFQSRVLANCEVAEHSVERNMYIKTANSVLRFSELYPMYTYYANATKFKKRVMDMWYSGQNVGTLTSYNNAIGGYTLTPSFFKRCEDYGDSWIISSSDVDIDNYLMGVEDQKYGIVIDVLGLSTLTQSASGECYNNTQNSVSDVGPVYWNLHHEQQPSGYWLFTDLYNNFENCTLDNMIYNDDFNISPDIVQQDCEVLSPVISTESIALTGNVEISVLDRIYSENIDRKVYYRIGDSSTLTGSWTEIEHPIGDIISLTSDYIQFRITATEILRQIDYEFQGLCLREYSSARVWLQLDEEEDDDMAFIELRAGDALLDKDNPPQEHTGGLRFLADGVNRRASWLFNVPSALRSVSPLYLRLYFIPSAGGTGVFTFQFASLSLSGGGTQYGTITRDLVVGAPSTIHYIDIDISVYFTADEPFVYVLIGRDSSDPGDTCADVIAYTFGITRDYS